MRVLGGIAAVCAALAVAAGPAVAHVGTPTGTVEWVDPESPEAQGSARNMAVVGANTIRGRGFNADVWVHEQYAYVGSWGFSDYASGSKERFCPDPDKSGVAVLDTRDPLDFAGGHLRGSVNVGLHGRFAEFAGDVLAADRPVVLVSEPGTELEAKVRLSRIGFDRIEGALSDPLRALLEHPEVVEPSSRLSVAELEDRNGEVDALQIVDVRNPGETAHGVIPGAATLPLPQLTARMSELDPARPTVVYCASGYRSSIGASVLAAAGFDDVSDLLGGYEAWKAQHQTGREKEPTA